MAAQTRHTPEQDMRSNYLWAQSQGFAGARDGLSHHRDIYGRVQSVPSGFPVVWSLHHYGPPPANPWNHALDVLDAIPDRPMILPVVEPSVGYDVSGMHPQLALGISLEFLRAIDGRADILTGDPVHRLAEEEWAITDALVSTGQVSVIGVHCYAHHLAVPLGDVIRAAKARYGLPVALGETSFHDGHPGNEGRPHGCRNRHEWKAYVEREAAEAEWACWMPVLGINWEGDEPWPSSWPEGQP